MNKIIEIRNRWYWGENIHLIYEGGYGQCTLEFKDNTTQDAKIDVTISMIEALSSYLIEGGMDIEIV